MNVCILDTSRLDARHSMHKIAHHIYDDLLNLGYKVTFISFNIFKVSSPLLLAFLRYFYYPLLGLTVKCNSVHIIDHSFGHIVPFLLFCKRKIFYIHDLIPLSSCKENNSAFHSKLLFYIVVFLGIFFSDRVVCVSNSTRESVLKFYPFVKCSKISSRYNITQIKDSARFLSISQIPAAFDVLLIGKNWYKNHIFTANSLLSFPYSLKIACLNVSPECSYLLQSSHHSISLLNNLTDISHLYCNSKLIINYSIEEGFGLTPFEAAFRNCCPVLSDIQVHKELHPLSSKFFVPLSSSEALNYRIQQFLENDDLRCLAIDYVKQDYFYLSKINPSISLYL